MRRTFYLAVLASLALCMFNSTDAQAAKLAQAQATNPVKHQGTMQVEPGGGESPGTPNCATHNSLVAAPYILVQGDQPQYFYYCKNSSETNPGDVPIHLRNASSLTIVVTHINPLARSFTISVNGTKYAEVSETSLASLLGIPSAVSSSQQQTRNSLGLLSECGLTSKVTSLRRQVDALIKLANAFRQGVNQLQQAYSSTIVKIETKSVISPEDIVHKATSLKGQLRTPLNLSTEPKVDDRTNGPLKPYAGNSYTDTATALSSKAKKLYGSLTAPTTGCTGSADAELQSDKAFLATLFPSAGESNSKLDDVIAEVQGSVSAAATIAQNIDSLYQIASNPQNFEIDYRIPPEDRTQSSVVVTVSWTNKNLLCPSTQPSQPTGPSNQSGQRSGTPQKSAGQPAACSAPSHGSTTFTLNFGQGPRVFESAGIAFSPLAQHSYSTGTVGSSAQCPATVGGSAAAGCIVDNGGSGWRLLPMGLVTVRYFDVHRAWWRPLVPNYLGFGAAIKSNSGTNLEYLMGPSWASPGQHVFFTFGGYVGEETKLAGGLTVGAQSVAPPSTLPTSTPYKWGVGFAITYTLGSQGGGGAKGKTTPATSSPSPTPGS